MDNNQQFPLIAKTLAELEDVLAEELIALGADDVEIGTRSVSFSGNKELMYKANIHCRTALRILKPVYTFKAGNADEVYQALKEFDWSQYLTLDTTFAIDAVVFSHIFHHSKYVAYRVKDAISDWFTERHGKRPSVSISNPDMMFNIHISHNTCTLSLDSSGESLHKRGYRIAQTEAPLNEVLAAGMVLKSGWRGESTFIDPMCGSGTLLIEAAMIALGIPPGIHRASFAFEKWNDFDEVLFSKVYNDDSSMREFNHQIIGSDVSSKAIDIAEKNIKNAGLKKYIELKAMSLQQYTEAPAPEGLLMTNPPYGERIKVDELEELYAMIGERLKHVFMGYRAFVLSYRKECFDSIGLKPERRFFLYNGALECEMREYLIFAGRRTDFAQEEGFENKRRGDDEAHYRRNSKEGYRRSKREERNDESQAPRREFSDRGKAGDADGRSQRSFDREQSPRRRYSDEKEGSSRGFRKEHDDRPRRDFDGDKDRRPRRDFGGEGEGRPRRSFGDDNDRRPKRDFDGDRNQRPRRDFGGEGEGRPRRSFGDDKDRRPKRDFDGDRNQRPRRDFGGDRESRPVRSCDGNKENRPRRDFSDRPKDRFQKDDKFDKGTRPPRRFGDDKRDNERRSFNRDGAASSRSFSGERKFSDPNRSDKPRHDGASPRKGGSKGQFGGKDRGRK